MKRGIILSLFVIILQCISFNSFAQDKKSEKREKIAEQEKMVKELLNSGAFGINVNRILPANGSSIHSNDGYFLKIKGDTISCYLPYFGKSRSPLIDPSNLRIEISNQKVKIKKSEMKKGGYSYKFTGNTDKTGEAFDFRITIYFSGSSTISVTPSLREFISYHGTITNIK